MTSRFYLLSVQALAAVAVIVFPCWDNRLPGPVSAPLPWQQLCQAVAVITGICRATGRTGFHRRSRHTHKSGTEKLIKLTLDTGCVPCPLSLFRPHSHLYNHLPFPHSSLFNHLLSILPPSHATHTHAHAQAHTHITSTIHFAQIHKKICLSPLKPAVYYCSICSPLHVHVFQMSPRGVFSSTPRCFTPCLNVVSIAFSHPHPLFLQVQPTRGHQWGSNPR